MSRNKKYQPAINYLSLRQERGKHFLDYTCTRRSAYLGRLTDPISLIYDLALLSDSPSPIA